MSKTKRTIGSNKIETSKGAGSFDINKYIPTKYQVLVAFAFIIILFLIFLNPIYFGGKTFKSGDISTMQSYQTFIDKSDYPLWNPFVFCGFPAAATVGPFRWFDLIAAIYSTVIKVLTSPFAVKYAGYTMYLFVLSLTSFFFARSKKATVGVSVFVSVATSFGTGLIVYLMIGHVSKLAALAMYPAILMILCKFQEKIKLLDVLLLVIAMHLLIITNHVQIIFYTLFAIGIYFVYYFVHSILKKDNVLRNQLFKSLGIFAVVTIIALAMSYDDLGQIYEYTPYSTRGPASINETHSGLTEKASSAHYDYNTQWSFSPGEVMTFIVPSYFGFGNSVYDGPLIAQPTEINTYFGQMEMVDVPMYMGIIVFFLGLFAIVTRWKKDPFVRFLTILSGVALTISFGKNFSVLFDLMYYYFPFFNKFRVPSMILVLVQTSFPMLAGLGIMKLISMKEETDLFAEKIIKYAAFAFSGLFVIFILLNSVIGGWFTDRLVDTGGEKMTELKPFFDYISQMFVSDLLIGFALTGLAFWLAYLFLKNKFNSQFLTTAFIVLVLIDLWRVDARGAQYQDNPAVQEQYSEPDYISAIKSQNDKEPYRLLNLKQDGSIGSFGHNGNYHAYFLIEDMYGYSGIKPRAFQDIIDVVGPANPTLWRMLNVKYLIINKPVVMPGLKNILTNDKTAVYQNEFVLPRAYFVNRVEKKSGYDFLTLLKTNSFDPKDVAYVEDKDLTVDKPEADASIKITKYEDTKIELEAKATGNNLIFIGNTFYPVGWKASVNGNKAELIKLNHGFTGIVVPKGINKVELVYAPSSYTIGKKLSLVLNVLLLSGLIVVIALKTKKKKSVNA